MKAYLAKFNKKLMTTNDQDEKITLEGGVWPQNLFMVELAKRTPTMLQEFMNVVGFKYAEDTLQVLIAPIKMELEQLIGKPRR